MTCSSPSAHDILAPLTREQIGLAPMEGVTDVAMRLWMSVTSAPAQCSTPFLRLTATFPESDVPKGFAPELTELNPAVNYRLVPQVMASSTDDVERFAPYLLDASPFIELNCGCPAPTVVGNGAGSSLLKDPIVFHKTISKLAANLGPGRLAVKMRLGFQAEQEFPDLLSAVADLPLARLTIHGRTRADRYLGNARWHWMELAAQRCDFPVCGSGDVLDANTLEQQLTVSPHVQHVLVGRGAIRNPWIFATLQEPGSNTELSLPVLEQALCCFATLEDWRQHDVAAIIQFAQTGAFMQVCGTDEGAWDSLFQNLCVARWGAHATPTELAVHPRALGRVKMLWSSLRSSLPEPFFSPSILRAASLSDFLQRLREAARQHGKSLISVSYNSEHDWIYAGGGKPQPTMDSSVRADHTSRRVDNFAAIL